MKDEEDYKVGYIKEIKVTGLGNDGGVRKVIDINFHMFKSNLLTTSYTSFFLKSLSKSSHVIYGTCFNIQG